jgi:hypothetical protein
MPSPLPTCQPAPQVPSECKGRDVTGQGVVRGGLPALRRAGQAECPCAWRQEQNTHAAAEDTVTTHKTTKQSLPALGAMSPSLMATSTPSSSGWRQRLGGGVGTTPSSEPAAPISRKQAPACVHGWAGGFPSHQTRCTMFSRDCQAERYSIGRS